MHSNILESSQIDEEITTKCLEKGKAASCEEKSENIDEKKKE